MGEKSPTLTDTKEVIKMANVMLNGEMVNFDVAVNLMDDEIREAVHADLAPCTDQEFMDEYVKRHEDKYGETFEIN
jgi:hypothetical protein